MFSMRLVTCRIVSKLIRASKFHPCLAKAGQLSRSMNNSSVDDIDLAGMRKAYKKSHEAFLESHLVSTDPLKQFGEWLKLASKTDGIGEANSMVLATATNDGLPSARPMLLKGFDTNGFQFYTNYESRKGKDLAENPRASLLFYWDVLNRSVRIEGSVEKLTEEESTAYFNSRPRESQIGACVSNQSMPIIRQTLIDKNNALKETYKDPDTVIPKPDYWGGYRVIPKVIEFWQGQSTRLHDRIVFRRLRDGETVDGTMLHQGENGWVYERLAP